MIFISKRFGKVMANHKMIWTRQAPDGRGQVVLIGRNNGVGSGIVLGEYVSERRAKEVVKLIRSAYQNGVDTFEMPLL